MKTCVQTLSIMAITAALSFGQDAPKGPKGPKGPGGQRPSPEKVFARLDADGDGEVTLEEFKANPRAQRNPERAGEIFSKMDLDSSGGVSFEEFKSHRPPHPPGKGGKGGKGKKRGGEGAAE